jgi:hypothetical protein
MARYVKGQRLPGQGGRRNPPGGRPTKEQQEIKKQAAEIAEESKKQAAQIAKEFIDTHVQQFLDSYLGLGTGKVIERKCKDGKVVKLVMLDPATVRHAIDKILPDDQMELMRPMVVQFLQFARNHNPPQLPTDEQRDTGMASQVPTENSRIDRNINGRGEEAGGKGLVPPALKFHGFSKRRK